PSRGAVRQRSSAPAEHTMDHSPDSEPEDVTKTSRPQDSIPEQPNHSRWNQVNPLRTPIEPPKNKFGRKIQLRTSSRRTETSIPLPPKFVKS
ncbi:hypothetical protein NPIL_474401, partial [Nephila pilipes]